jgi:hypothetical protein
MSPSSELTTMKKLDIKGGICTCYWEVRHSMRTTLIPTLHSYHAKVFHLFNALPLHIIQLQHKYEHDQKYKYCVK